jgi:hypothetical protein
MAIVLTSASLLSPDARSVNDRAPFAVSVRMKAANCSGVLPTGSRACAAKYSRAAFVCRIAPTSRRSRSMMGCGVPAGAAMPSQPIYSKSGRPDSATVGTSGSAASRVGLVTASARIFPALICGSCTFGALNVKSNRPAIRSSIAAGGPA